MIVKIGEKSSGSNSKKIRSDDEEIKMEEYEEDMELTDERIK